MEDRFSEYEGAKYITQLWQLYELRRQWNQFSFDWDLTKIPNSISTITIFIFYARYADDTIVSHNKNTHEISGINLYINQEKIERVSKYA